MKTKIQRPASLLICFFTFLLLNAAVLRADDARPSYESLKETTGKYFSEKKYNECVEYLESLAGKESEASPALDYFIALTRYNQLKGLEESQDWNEYFSNGNDYRADIKSYAEEAVSATTPKDKINASGRLILWQLYRDQDDKKQDEALSALVDSVVEYAKAGGDAALIKDIADSLVSYGEKISSRRLYKVYVEKLAASQISDAELKSSADAFYNKGNLELSEALYDAYINRISAPAQKDKLAPALKEIARQFIYNPASGSDAEYAEKVFTKMEELVGKDSFDEEALYLRAFNLEKAKEFAKAKDIYQELVSRFPASSRANEALYKTGLIYVYALRSLNDGRACFERLAAKGIADPQAIAGIYQLGLLAQWEGDNTKAGQYYDKLLELAKDGYAEKANFAKARLKEISESKPLDYNLNLFLDVSLKPENTAFDSGKADLRFSPYVLKAGGTMKVSVSASAGETGCMPVGLQYLWSGDLGSASVTPEENSFETSYGEAGTKQINLVVASSTGVVGRSVDIADVSH